MLWLPSLRSFKRAEEPFWNCRFVACDQDRLDAEEVFAQRHFNNQGFGGGRRQKPPNFFA